MPRPHPRPAARRASPVAIPLTVATGVALAAVGAAPLAGARVLAQAGGTTPASPSTPVAPIAPVALAGTVYDSLARAPLAGAVVQLVRADNAASARSATTDASGAFRFDSLASGRYLLGFLHPTLDLLAIQVNPVVVVAEGRPLPAVALAVPGPAAVRAAVCPATTPADSGGAVAGVVRDAASGDAVPGATVVLSWGEIGVSMSGVRRETRRVPTTVRADGGFLVCGVPTDVPIQASATAPGATSGLVELTPPPRGLLVQQFALGPVATAAAAPEDSAAAAARGGLPRPAPGSARLAGRVVGPNGQPLPGARVRVWGADGRAETGADGRFALAGLPAGTYTVEVLGIGFEPSRTPVDLANGRTAEARIALATPAVQLARVSVTGKSAERAGLLEDFERRRRAGGQGRYFTAADIAQRKAFEVTDVIRGVATLNVVPRGGRGNVLRGRRNCVPNVWLDGNLVRNGANEIDDVVPAGAVAAIEVYGGGSIIPAQFNATGTGGSLSGGATCGAVVIWTNR